LLTRIFAPEAFGLAQAYQSALLLLLMFSALRYEVALLQAMDGSEVQVVLRLCLVVNIFTTLLVTLAIAIINALDADLLSEPTHKIMWWLPVGMLVGGFVQTIGYLQVRQKDFSIIATTKIVQVASYAGVGSGIGAFSGHPLGLVLADISGRFASLMVSLRNTRTRSLLWSGNISAVTLRQSASKFRALPITTLPGSLINAAGGGMTALIIYNVFDASVAGQYALVERSLMLPVAMVGGAVAQAFTADLSARLRDGEYSGAKVLFRRTLKVMLLIGAVPAGLVAQFSPMVFNLLFGVEWEMAGEFARLMAPLAWVAFAGMAVNMTILVSGWQKVQLAWEILRLTAIVGTWWYVKTAGMPPLPAVFLHVVVNMAVSIAYLIAADILIRK
jgi:O-antigen/teichoic acid export membrane protein